MRIRKEKGFKTIKIVDPSIEAIDQINDSENFCTSKICLIISTIIAFIILSIIIIYLIYDRNKVKKINCFTERAINQNRTNDCFKSNDNIFNYNFSQEKKNNIENYNISEILKDTNKTIEKQESSTNDNIKISIIIMNNDRNIENNLSKLFESIESQSFPNKEIIIVKTNTSNISDELNLNKKATIVEYGENTGRLKQRYDIVNMAKGEYILFIEGDDEFSSNEILNQIYEKANNAQLDILEYKSYHQTYQKNKIFYQPELFSMMYFGSDNFNRQSQFHLCGKLINREFFLNTFKKEQISPFYFNKNIQNYDQSMILLILFRYAEKFEVFQNSGTNKSCKKCEKNKYASNINEAMDLLIYMKFLVEHTGNNVPEKRMAANIFVNDFMSKRINFEYEEDLNTVIETIDLYLNCDKIGEEDIYRIMKYKDNIVNKVN